MRKIIRSLKPWWKQKSKRHLTPFLFPDTKLPENVPQNFVGGDGAGDGSQVVQCFSHFLRDEVAGDFAGEALRRAHQRLLRALQRLVMAKVCHHRLVGRHRSKVHMANHHLNQRLNALPAFCRDVNRGGGALYVANGEVGFIDGHDEPLRVVQLRADFFDGGERLGARGV